MSNTRNNRISKYSGAGAFVVVPLKAGAVVTQKDQKALGALQTWRNARFTAVHFLAERRDAVLARIKAAKLSKKMKVVEISDRQWELRGSAPETIPGTDIVATRKQLAEAFAI